MTDSHSDSLEQLRSQLAAFARQRDWEGFHSPKNLAMALIAEAAELVEHFQWLSEDESRRLSADKLAEVRLELADILIYLIRTADQLDVDLIAAASGSTGSIRFKSANIISFIVLSRFFGDW